MPYRAPVAEALFVLNRIAGFADVAATPRFADATPDLVAAILTSAGRLCEDGFVAGPAAAPDSAAASVKEP